MKVLVRIAVCSLLIFGAFGSSHAMGQFFMLENPLVGEKAPEFSLKTAQGNDVTLTQLREGRNAMVFFWATWCPHCMEQLKRLAGPEGEAIEKKGIKIILVDIGESAAAVNSYVKKHKLRFDVLLDQDEKVSEQYHLVGVPTFIFIGKDGVVRSVEHAIPDDIDGTFADKP